MTHHRLDHRLGGVHVVIEVGKGHLRLDHPELRRMARGVAVLSPEGRPEGVHLAQREGHRLRLQLARDGQIGLPAEEVPAVIHLSLLGAGRVVRVDGGHPEHLARALAVRAGDQRGVDIDKAVSVEEVVQREGRLPPHPEGRGEGVGPRPQMGHRAQKLHRVPLFLQRVLRRADALDGDGVGVQLKGLLCVRGQHDPAGDHQRGADAALRDLLEVFQLRGLKHHLQRPMKQ